MKQFEAPLTWVLGVAFIAYMTLTNCCSEKSMQSVLSGDNMNINAPALTIEDINLNQPIHIAEEQLSEPFLQNAGGQEEDIDTLKVENNEEE